MKLGEPANNPTGTTKGEAPVDKSEFTSLFLDASNECVAFARKFVIDHLPDTTVYAVFPNSSYDGNPLHPDECIFPDDALPPDEFHWMTAEQVINFLWRDGMVPEWVDLNVVAATEQHTVVELICCGRFTANRDLLYYNRVNRGPFGVKGPWLPPDYDSKNPKPFALFNPRDRRRK